MDEACLLAYSDDKGWMQMGCKSELLGGPCGEVPVAMTSETRSSFCSPILDSLPLSHNPFHVCTVWLLDMPRGRCDCLGLFHVPRGHHGLIRDLLFPSMVKSLSYFPHHESLVICTLEYCSSTGYYASQCGQPEIKRVPRSQNARLSS